MLGARVAALSDAYALQVTWDDKMSELGIKETDLQQIAEFMHCGWSWERLCSIS
jgi:hypothetical protein